MISGQVKVATYANSGLLTVHGKMSTNIKLIFIIISVTYPEYLQYLIALSSI